MPGNCGTEEIRVLVHYSTTPHSLREIHALCVDFTPVAGWAKLISRKQGRGTGNAKSSGARMEIMKGVL
jgi:hypothetical protein